jgi:integrase
MALNAIKINTAKPKDKDYKLADEKGLFLLVKTNGSKYWRFKYRFNGKEKLLALGVYPDVSLADARDRRDNARKQLANGADPGLVKSMNKQAVRAAAENSFEAVAREWHAKYSSKWTEDHGKRILIRLEKDIFPWLGSTPINEIVPPKLLAVLRRIESRGAVETAHRAHQNCSQIFRYAIATGRAERDSAADLRGALQPVKSKHHASITDPKEIAKLMKAIHDYKGFIITKCALKLAPLVFVRPGELRKAEWSEINFETAEWRIPASKMKMRVLHLVPLSRQAIEILKEIQPLTGHRKYVFPGVQDPNRPMSENTVTGALRRLGYTGEEMTGHGFRSMACTILNEQGWNKDAIERQLAHAERNNVRAAYNYAEHLPERRRMMQEWADYLESFIKAEA